MTLVAGVGLVLGLAGLFYIYVGFPLLLILVGKLRNRRYGKEDITPDVTLIIAAYNEEECIEARITNALAADYPSDRLEVIVASDGSSDRTNEIVAACSDPRVRLLRLPRRGKIFALSDAVRSARGDVLVFSDANTVVDTAALRTLVRNFADPRVGGVVGHTGYRIDPGSESSSRGESLYWRYDSWLKELESRSGSVVSAHGGLYAIRRELYEIPTETAVTDDFIISTAVIVQGYRLVFEPAARAWEAAIRRADREFSRRVRLMTRGFRAVASRAELLNPLRYGFYSIVLLSHKVLRRLALPLLALVLFSTLVLSTVIPVFRVAVAVQLIFYSAALLGFQLRGRAIGQARLLYVPFFYCMANVAALIALVRFLRGDRIVSWQPQRHVEPI